MTLTRYKQGERHHWLPIVLLKRWSVKGLVGALTSDGVVRHDAPKDTAAIEDLHNMPLGGPWTASIEPLFDEADNEANVPSTKKPRAGRRRARQACRSRR